MTVDIDIRIGDIASFEDEEFGVIVGRVLGDEYAGSEYGKEHGYRLKVNGEEWRTFLEPLIPGAEHQFDKRSAEYQNVPAYLDWYGPGDDKQLFVRANTLTVVQRPER